MADSIQLNPSSGGATIRTDEVGGEHYQCVKLAHGADGEADLVAPGKGLPTTPAGHLQAEVLAKFLSTDNTGNAGTSEGAVDGTSDKTFYLQPTTSLQKLLIRSLRMVVVADSFEDGVFAAMSAALSTGVHLQLNSNSTLVSDLTGGHAIKSNEDFFKHGRVEVLVMGSKEVLTLEVDLPAPVLLDGANTDERVAFVVTDDLTAAGIDSLMVMAKGLKL